MRKRRRSRWNNARLNFFSPKPSKKHIFNLFTESEKVTDPFPKPYHKDYGFDWEASIFRGYVDDWCGRVEHGKCVTMPTPRFTRDNKERWPYCPDGSPREFREKDGAVSFGPRPDSELPPSLPKPADWGAPPTDTKSPTRTPERSTKKKSKRSHRALESATNLAKIAREYVKSREEWRLPENSKKPREPEVCPYLLGVCLYSCAARNTALDPSHRVPHSFIESPQPLSESTHTRPALPPRVLKPGANEPDFAERLSRI